MFLDWCRKTNRILTNPLSELERYNAQTDLRHERRSISIGEFSRLLDAARNGRTYGQMTGQMRELCYRFTFFTGLRFSEVKALRSDWFDWETLTVTIPAKFSKNRKTKTLPIDSKLAEDLKNHIATLDPGLPIFPMPKRGYAMIQTDLKVAGIPYDLNGKIFDFHALRGMTATILDEIGTPDGVRRNLMRHSSQTMTNLYTRPRDDQARDAITQLASTLNGARTTAGSTTDSVILKDDFVPSLYSDCVYNGHNGSVGAGAIPAASTCFYKSPSIRKTCALKRRGYVTRCHRPSTYRTMRGD